MIFYLPQRVKSSTVTCTAGRKLIYEVSPFNILKIEISYIKKNTVNRHALIKSKAVSKPARIIYQSSKIP